MQITEPYHPGELSVQRRLGEQAEAARNGRAIADTIVRGAFKFVEQQPFVVLGSVEAQGKTWASLIFGEPGFTRVIDERTLVIDLARACPHPADPARAALADDPRVGLLYIEPGTRRRLRINGTVERDGSELRLAVEEAYPNCPKYIQRRHLRTSVDLNRVRSAPPVRGRALDPAHVDLIRAADTCFVASSNPDRGVDASHRGGNPGFVKLLGERTLAIPDYPGNHMYNTLGNFVLEPRAGLTFLDFETGDTLLLTGRASVVWEQPGSDAETGGTKRFWHFEVDEWVSFTLPARLEWELIDSSPFNPAAR